MSRLWYGIYLDYGMARPIFFSCVINTPLFCELFVPTGYCALCIMISLHHPSQIPHNSALFSTIMHDLRLYHISPQYPAQSFPVTHHYASFTPLRSIYRHSAPPRIISYYSAHFPSFSAIPHNCVAYAIILKHLQKSSNEIKSWAIRGVVRLLKVGKLMVRKLMVRKLTARKLSPRIDDTEVVLWWTL